MRLDFENLPLIEAVLRLSFAKPIALNFAAVTGIHEKVRKRFPEVNEPAFLEAAPGLDELALPNPLGVSGAIFAGDGNGIRVQNWSFKANWIERGPPI